MELSKNTMQALGALTLAALLAGAGFLVIKPQFDNAGELQELTEEVNQNIELRELRLAKLENEKENIEGLQAEVDDFLLRTPSTKSVTNIAGAVVASLSPGVHLISFSHGELNAEAPVVKTPEVSLTPLKAPFDLKAPAPKAEEAPAIADAEAEAPPVETVEPTTPAFAGAPFIITVNASSFADLTGFIDAMQQQKRLLTITSVVAGASDKGLQATIYGYAFTSSNPKILEWEAKE